METIDISENLNLFFLKGKEQCYGWKYNENQKSIHVPALFANCILKINYHASSSQFDEGSNY